MKVILLFYLSLASALVRVSLTRDSSFHHLANIYQTEGAFKVETTLDNEIAPGRYCVSLDDENTIMNECASYLDFDSNPALQIVVYTKDDEIYSISASKGTSGLTLKAIEIPTEEIQAPRELEEIKEKKAEEKSFIQKNWMYIVPPLAIMFFMLPDDEPKK